jgi:hypothetical protein
MPKSPKFIRLRRINSRVVKTAYAVVEMAYATAKTWNFLDKPDPIEQTVFRKKLWADTSP